MSYLFDIPEYKYKCNGKLDVTEQDSKSIQAGLLFEEKLHFLWQMLWIYVLNIDRQTYTVCVTYKFLVSSTFYIFRTS